MPSNELTDAQVNEAIAKALGWRCVDNVWWMPNNAIPVYAFGPVAIDELLEAMKARGWSFSMSDTPEETYACFWREGISMGETYGPTRKAAIALAALAALEAALESEAEDAE